MSRENKRGKDRSIDMNKYLSLYHARINRFWKLYGFYIATHWLRKRPQLATGQDRSPLITLVGPLLTLNADRLMGPVLTKRCILLFEIIDRFLFRKHLAQRVIYLKRPADAEQTTITTWTPEQMREIRTRSKREFFGSSV